MADRSEDRSSQEATSVNSINGIAWPASPDDIWVAVVGQTGVGKTTFISHCIGQPMPEDGSGLSSCTIGVGLYPMKHNGKTIQLVDTPGFDDTTRSDAEILQELAFWLGKSYEHGIRLSGIIYLHRISDERVKGSTLRALNAFKAICGEENYSGIVLASTRWDQAEPEKAGARQEELCTDDILWGDMVKGGAFPTAVFDWREFARLVLNYFVWKQKKMTFLIQRQMVLEGKLIHETDAGKILYDDHINETKTLDSEIAGELEELKRARSKFYDQKQNAAREAIERLKKDRNIRQERMQSLEVDMKCLDRKWGKKIHETLEEVKPALEKTGLPRTLLEDRLKELREGSVSTSSGPSVCSEEPRELNPDKNGVQIVRRDKHSHHPSVTTMSTIVGTGLALGQFVAMLACTVM